MQSTSETKWPKLRSRLGLTLVTWVIGAIAVIGLLFGVGSLGDSAFFWATIASTVICKEIHNGCSVRD